MGTFHTDHFEKYANYSIQEMINAIDNIDPDVVYIDVASKFSGESSKTLDIVISIVIIVVAGAACITGGKDFYERKNCCF